MQVTLVKGVHNLANIDTELMDMFQTIGLSVSETPVIRIVEGEELDFRTRTFNNTMEIAKLIDECFKTTDVINRIVMSLDDSDNILYVLFLKTNDRILTDLLSNALLALAC